jgi:signal transduction histidine kinase
MKDVQAPEAVYRRRRLAGLIAILGVLTLVVNGSQWLEHRRLRRLLADELGDHLVVVAEVAAVAIDGDMLKRWHEWGVDPDEAEEERQRLSTVRAASGASNLLLLDAEAPAHAFLDLSGITAAGDSNPALALDRAALTLAAAGIPAASPLYSAAGGGYLKTGFAPITADDGTVTGILGIEGSSALFALLDLVRSLLIVVSVASLAGVTLLGFLLVRLSESLARAERDLLQAETLAAMGRMAAGIAHEIRNPLGIIRATAERLERRYAGGAVDPHFRSIPEEVDRLSGILNGYLAFAADRPSELRPLDLVPLVRQAAATDEPALAQARVRLETRVGVSEAPVLGDPARLRQVLLNLVLNAQQAMPEGGTVTVGLEADPHGGGFELRVADEGVGIPRPQLAEVWKPFFTSKPSGSGLGLAIVRRIVDEHGGTIEIDSVAGRGTVITIRLPGTALARRARTAEEGRG